MSIPTILLPLEGARLRRGWFVDVDHHRLDLDRGLEPGESVLARCLDDRGWLLTVVDLEFSMAATRYLLEVLEPVVLPPSPVRRGRPVTSRQTAELLDLLAATTRAPASAGVETAADAPADAGADATPIGGRR